MRYAAQRACYMRKLIPQPSSSSLRSGPSPKSRPRTTRHDRRRRQQAFQALLQRQQDNISDNKRNFLSGGLWLGACISIALSLGITSQGAASAKPTDYPGQISSTGEEPRRDLGKLIRGEKGKEIQDCSRKCIPTCLRGGEGAPGLGPMTVRKDLIVFKDGFRDRKYCLTECTSVCAISYLGEGAK